MREQGEEVIGKAIQVAEVGGSAALLGYLKGRSGTVNDKGELVLEVAGVPVDLGVAIAGHVVGFAGIAGRQADHVHNIANGALAAWLSATMVSIGKEASNEAGVATQGTFPPPYQRGGLPPPMAQVRRGMWANPAHAYM